MDTKQEPTVGIRGVDHNLWKAFVRLCRRADVTTGDAINAMTQSVGSVENLEALVNDHKAMRDHPELPWFSQPQEAPTK